MKNKKYIFILSIFIVLFGCKTEKKKDIPNKIKFEISDYNLLFTKVEINNKEYTALIDFGDFAAFQFSTKLIAELNLKTEKSDIIMSDINGNQYALEKGTIKELKVDGKTENNVTFFSANNEIDAVSKEVGTDFQVVVGFGYFKSKDFKLDFVENSIEFIKPKVDETDFSVSINNDYGYLISNFKSSANERINLLFDTGTPISKIDLNLFPLDLKDSIVNFQNTEFPSKNLDVKSSNQTITLNMENNDVSELEPLGVVGIYGVNDMMEKVFIYNALEKVLRIKTTGNNVYKK
ncbi:retropepsin-like domain-containing protein [Polaribacter sp.]|nr:retropepsin-like domain-containing protein [Polaribacter sp.]